MAGGSVLSGFDRRITSPPDPVFSHRLLVKRASCIIPAIAVKGLLQSASNLLPIQPLDAVKVLPGFSNLIKPFPADEHPALTFELMTVMPSGPPAVPGNPAI